MLTTEGWGGVGVGIQNEIFLLSRPSVEPEVKPVLGKERSIDSGLTGSFKISRAEFQRF